MMHAHKGWILLAEDPEDTRDLTVLVVEQSDFEVVTASRISDTLKLAKLEDFSLFTLIPDSPMVRV